MYTEFQIGQAVPGKPVQLDIFDVRPTSKGKRQTLPAEERFQLKLKRRKNGCIEFTGAEDFTTGGYGKFGLGEDRTVYAHRYAWEQKYGAIPAGLQIRHVCHNPLCCNTDHHLLGTSQQNAADKVASGRKPKPIKKEQALFIVKLHYEKGQTMQALAKRYNVTETTMRNLLVGKTYVNITGIVFRPAKPHQRKLKETA